MIRLDDGTVLDVPAPVRCFQRYTSEMRADMRASHRLGYRQREAVGEHYWTHPLVPGVAFPTRAAAIRAVIAKLATRDRLSVMLCVNDPEHGMPTGGVCAVHVDGIELESPSYPDGGPVYRHSAHMIRVGRRVYPIQGYQAHVGNWCWDAVSMRRADVRRLLTHLVAWGFTVTAGPVETDLLPAECP